MKKLMVIVYVLLCAVAFILSTGEGYFGIGSGFSMLLTLPWSFLALFFFSWVLVHDGARSILVFLVPLAVLNAVLLYKLTTRKAPPPNDGPA